ncbi:ATP-binding protein [Pendulispora albinea]|uniref:histidine kinase n=1 Tax=Pendulispora albinea TaxID=2741071 RepID=A0ABZ2LQS8_9BACT
MNELLVLPRQRRRFSLRLRVMAAIVLVALAPSMLVFAWSLVDRQVPGRMWGTVRDAAEEAKRAIEEDAPASELSRVARARKVRLRILDENGAAVFDVDADSPGDAESRVESFVFGAKDGTTAREFDEQLGPMLVRPDVLEAKRAGWYVACDYLPLVLCQAIAISRTGASAGEGKTRIVHVQMSSWRAVQEVYVLRAHLLKLTMVILPLAIVLAFYMGRRVVRPIEQLRQQALAKAAAESPKGTLLPERHDEVGVLADAFNALLVALGKKRADNEAFVADLVHELKNPLAAVRAAADTLAESAIDPARAERLSRVLRDSTTKLDRLVTQFLELARAEAGMPNEERSEVELGALVTGLVESLRDDPRYTRVTFVSKEIEAGSPPARVRGVVHRLDALFRELLENAASFAGDGGHVGVVIGQTSGEVIVAVHDDGPGVAAGDLPRVFDRFFTTRGSRRGTGLGLSLVKAVAEAHGGQVTVRAAAGEGTTFEVRLPRLVR